MHPSLQAKLLRVLQHGTFSPLGSRITERVNVRIIAAANIDMSKAFANKTFREDLTTDSTIFPSRCLPYERVGRLLPCCGTFYADTCKSWDQRPRHWA